MLSEGRPRANLVGLPLGLILAGVVVLAVVGGFVTVRALMEWLT